MISTFIRIKYYNKIPINMIVTLYIFRTRQLRCRLLYLFVIVEHIAVHHTINLSSRL